MSARRIPGVSSELKDPNVARDGAMTSVMIGVGFAVGLVGETTMVTRRMYPTGSERSFSRREFTVSLVPGCLSCVCVERSLDVGSCVVVCFLFDLKTAAKNQEPRTMATRQLHLSLEEKGRIISHYIVPGSQS
jgi:hypothetical protein